jgi:tetratricopeptide (TPR) repeat protein/tRNA A-37 threonylcarbamoyl transferase component Bud32
MATLIDRLRVALTDRYAVEREIGRGGMATVYLSVDLKHRRRVAIKVLRPELSATLASERFLREIEVAAQLAHPHILPLFDSGETDDLVYYVMPYIEGESLRDRLRRQTRLPIDDVLRIGRQVTAALRHAHGHGVIHRDIKPENILLADGEAVVADFGIARAITQAGREHLTGTGVMIGTPTYMSPEQASGERVDERSDIYSLGCVLYEMLVGRPPFTASTPMKLIASHARQDVPRLRAKRPDVPEAVDEAVRRALSKRPGDRYRTASEFEKVLRESTRTEAGRSAWVIPLALIAYVTVGWLTYEAIDRLATDYFLPSWVSRGVLAVLLAGLTVFLLTAIQRGFFAGRRPDVRGLRWADNPLYRILSWRNSMLAGVGALLLVGAWAGGYLALRALGIGPPGTLIASGVLGERERIIVTEFESAARDSALAGAVTEAVRADLSRSPAVSVVPREQIAAVLRLMERDPTVRVGPDEAREVALRDGVEAMTIGGVSRAGPGFVLTVNVVLVESGESMASARELATDSTQIIRAIERLSRRVRERIGESLASLRSLPPLSRVTTSSLDALRKYSQALGAQFRQGDYARAVALYEEAVEEDSTFASAYRRLGVAYGRDGGSPQRRVDALTKAFEYRTRTGDLERYLIEATYHQVVTWDIEQAAAAYRSVLALDPEHRVALNNLANVYGRLRDWTRAEDMYRRNIERGELVGLRNIAIVQFAQGKFDEAAASLAVAADSLPGNPDVELDRYRLASASGDYGSAETRLMAIRRSQSESLRWQAETSRHLGWQARLLGRLATAKGHWRDAMAAHLLSGSYGAYLVDATELANLESLYPGDRAGALSIVDDALRRIPLDSVAPLNRPYAELAAFFARHGDRARARALIDVFGTAADPRFADPQGIALHEARAWLALAEERPQEAIELWRELTEKITCPVCNLPPLGLAFEVAGAPDSTISIYERYLTTPWLFRQTTDAHYRAVVLERLGQLYDERGDSAKAAENYAKFVALWTDADPELQSRVRAAQRRLAEILAQLG